MFSLPESLKFITERLGAFQDICIFLGFVHMHSNEAEEEEEQVLLQRIKTELGKRKETMKKELWSFLEESRQDLEAWKPTTTVLNL